MVSPPHLKSLQHLPALSMKSSSSSTTLTHMKLKTLLQTFIFSQVCRLIRALAKAKSIFIEIVKNNIHPKQFILSSKTSKLNKHKKKIFFGSFRLHYNWCSSHVTPVPAPILNETMHSYYDSTWNSIISTEPNDHGESELSGYLHWLEEKVCDNNNASSDQKTNEIDRLADVFIANCYEKFRLEKQESYRRFQEMLARSM
ncbi:uncharacterized protein LOC123228240 [Mangifera indica]|uniref:uncharacterized protein LOC123228240 n=1 Tax=Mangifera indica TaxID=29780 RepID=UPI001CFB03D8|nr:uncharacterized protein LOC123228240 [Mangifera indica]